MQANDIHSLDDIVSLREWKSKLLSEINAIKTSLAEGKNKLVRYSDIRDIYNEISRGDYISKLVEEEKFRREQEKNKQTTKKNKRKGR